MPTSSRPSFRPTVLLAAFTAAVLLSAGVASAAYAGPRSASTAVVTMGDSYISGEAGRWLGNSINSCSAPPMAASARTARRTT